MLARRTIPFVLVLVSALGVGAGAAAQPCGDADGDGALTEVDGVRVLAAASGRGACDPAVCDVDGDHRVTDIDARRVLRAAAGVPAALICGRAADDDGAAGGVTTVFDSSRNAFGFPAGTLSDDERRDFFTGNALFNRNWVAAPASTDGIDGLGPTFNARSCSSCHFRDGRGRAPEPGDTALSMIVRLSIPGYDAINGAVAEPTYGLQLNDAALPGVPSEGRESVGYVEEAGAFGDGEPYALRRPQLAFTDLAFGALSGDVRTSARVAPHLVGLGLLSAIPDGVLRALADSRDADGDGISGRVNEVWDRRAGATAIGRLGWKANVASVEEQVSGALLGDIGITSPLFLQENCPIPQAACAAAINGGSPEADQLKIDLLTFYSLALAVPARRDVEDEEVRRGALLFGSAGCAGCHVPTLTTGDFAVAAVAHQMVHPYTDLLLHDMGEGLADGRPDFEASGREWRTPPLWGIGLFSIVNEHTSLLHDGRARNVAEAILWHGGEAAASRDAFRAMSSTDRAALVRFIGSL